MYYFIHCFVAEYGTYIYEVKLQDPNSKAKCVHPDLPPFFSTIHCCKTVSKTQKKNMSKIHVFCINFFLLWFSLICVFGQSCVIFSMYFCWWSGCQQGVQSREKIDPLMQFWHTPTLICLKITYAFVVHGELSTITVKLLRKRCVRNSLITTLDDAPLWVKKCCTLTPST